MKPYDQIDVKQIVKWGIPIILTLAFASFFSARLLGMFRQEIACTFCNPTLWFLGLDDLMWEIPKDPKRSIDNTQAFGVFAFLSFVVHLAAFIAGIIGLVKLWKRILGKRSTNGCL